MSQADKKLAELGGSYNSIEAARLDATRMWNVQEYVIFTQIFE